MKLINVLLAEDHTLFREGLRALLNAEADISVVGDASDGREAIELTYKLKPDVLVMDISMPVLNGLEAARQILEKKHSTKILILSAHSNDAYVEKVMTMGASGYLVKESAFLELSNAIRSVVEGKTCYSPALSRRFAGLDWKMISQSGALKQIPYTLTNREVEVLQLVAEGNANKVIADILYISIKTVEKHRQSLMAKLDIHDAASLTRYAIKNGIVESSPQLVPPFCA